MTANVNTDKKLFSLPVKLRLRRGLAFGVIIITALIMFEAFNYSTTEYALNDLLGDLSFLGIAWATILAIAFCGIDFAGIARLFTPEEGANEPTEVWYLFGAWLLAATMNAMLTWWGVSQAILNNPNLGNEVIERSTALRVVPIFVAILVWLIRVLIIGTFSVAGDRLFSQRDGVGTVNGKYVNAPNNYVLKGNPAPVPAPRPNTTKSTFRPAPKSTPPPEPVYSHAEPTYQQMSMSGSTGASTSNSTRGTSNSVSNPVPTRGYNNQSVSNIRR
jgi:hypothetical protein